MSPWEQRDLLVQKIQEARGKLEKYPASCSNRKKREDAFRALYELNDEHFSTSPEDTDRAHRVFADYVFGQLVYTESKTCCWNSSTHDMYEIVMKYNELHVYDEASLTCNQPVVFRARDGGYGLFRDYAEELGLGHLWMPWSADEQCPQAMVQDDVEAPSDATPLCDIADAVLDIPVVVAVETAMDGENTECGDVSTSGQCEGNTLTWCLDENLAQDVCDHDETCAWNSEANLYDCIPFSNSGHS
jgi:hypothetical protein